VGGDDPDKVNGERKKWYQGAAFRKSTDILRLSKRKKEKGISDQEQLRVRMERSSRAFEKKKWLWLKIRGGMGGLGKGGGPVRQIRKFERKKKNLGRKDTSFLYRWGNLSQLPKAQ